MILPYITPNIDRIANLILKYSVLSIWLDLSILLCYCLSLWEKIQKFINGHFYIDYDTIIEFVNASQDHFLSVDIEKSNGFLDKSSTLPVTLKFEHWIVKLKFQFDAIPLSFFIIPTTLHLWLAIRFYNLFITA